MTLSADEVRKLARLSRLHLEDDELERLGGQLNQIVGYVEQLSEVDVDGIEPMAHAVPMDQPRRPDDVLEEVAARRALEGSAGYEDGLVRVPKIVE
jgi:aspartyl-tRNA(Asn)/glutamyl-tRNA(Gln) amidotransferase subunit C